MRLSVSPILSMSLTMSMSPSPMDSAWRWIESITSLPDMPPSIIMVSRVSRAFMKSPERADLIIEAAALSAGVSVSSNIASRSTFFPLDAAVWRIPRAFLMSPPDAMAMPSAAPSARWTFSSPAISVILRERASRGTGLKRTVLHLDLTGSMIIDGWLHARMNAQFPE